MDGEITAKETRPMSRGVWLIAHARDTRGQLMFYPPVGAIVASRDGRRKYLVQKDGSLRRWGR